MIIKKVVAQLSIILCSIVIFASCVNTRNSKYFVDQNDAVLETATKNPETIITPGHLLSINVSSLNPDATAIFNAKPDIGGQQGPGYLVNKEGNIQFPILGNIKAEKLTGDQLRQDIVKLLVDKKLLIDPIVSVRFLNFKVTVLGEVNRPTVIDVPNERISLLEALGFAGDITIYGQKENVMVIREEDNKKIIKRINLNSSELFGSPYYYLKSNDIVYVEANKAKVASSTRTSQLLPIILTALSFTAIVVDRVFRP